MQSRAFWVVIASLDRTKETNCAGERVCFPKTATLRRPRCQVDVDVHATRLRHLLLRRHRFYKQGGCRAGRGGVSEGTGRRRANRSDVIQVSDIRCYTPLSALRPLRLQPQTPFILGKLR